MASCLKGDDGSLNLFNRDSWTEIRATHIKALVCCVNFGMWPVSSKMCISLKVSTALDTEHQYHPPPCCNTVTKNNRVHYINTRHRKNFNLKCSTYSIKTHVTWYTRVKLLFCSAHKWPSATTDGRPNGLQTTHFNNTVA